MRKKRRLKKLVVIMGYYAIVFMALLLIFLLFFNHFLFQYEESRITTAINNYMESLNEERLKEISNEYVNSLDEDKNINAEMIYKTIKEPLSYAKKNKESTANRISYAIVSDDQAIGEAVFTKEDNPKFGFSKWKLEKETYDFSYLLTTKEITIPNSWHIYMNDKEVEEDNIVDNIYLKDIEDLYEDDRFNLPYFKTYQLEQFANSEIIIKDDSGEIRNNILSEEELIDNCLEEEKNSINSLINEFLPRYILCLSNSNHNATNNYNAIKPYILDGSDIDNRLYEAIEGQFWTNGFGDEIYDLVIQRITNLGNSYYMVDLDFNLHTLGNVGETNSENKLRFIIINNGNYLVSDVISR